MLKEILIILFINFSVVEYSLMIVKFNLYGWNVIIYIAISQVKRILMSLIINC